MIELSLTRTDTPEIESLQGEYLAMLAPDEAQRAARLHHPAVRTEFLTARALARTALSEVTGDDPSVWRFALGDHGKPAIASPKYAGLEFNLTHTHALVACAVHQGGLVGVDAEDCRRHNGGIELARRFFAQSEAAALERAAEEDRRALFFRFWTLKESFIKARGRGMSLPLDQFAFALSPDAPPRIDFAADGETSPEAWQFAELRIRGWHQLALCVQASGAPMTVCVREAVPLLRRDAPRELPMNPNRSWTL